MAALVNFHFPESSLADELVESVVGGEVFQSVLEYESGLHELEWVSHQITDAKSGVDIQELW